MGSLPVSIREGYFTTLADMDKTQGIGRFKEGLWAGESKCFQAVTKDGHIPQDDIVNTAVFF